MTISTPVAGAPAHYAVSCVYIDNTDIQIMIDLLRTIIPFYRVSYYNFIESLLDYHSPEKIQMLVCIFGLPRRRMVFARLFLSMNCVLQVIALPALRRNQRPEECASDGARQQRRVAPRSFIVLAALPGRSAGPSVVASVSAPQAERAPSRRSLHYSHVYRKRASVKVMW